MKYHKITGKLELDGRVLEVRTQEGNRITLFPNYDSWQEFRSAMIEEYARNGKTKIIPSFYIERASSYAIDELTERIARGARVLGDGKVFRF